jgi:hypothetical protein
VRATVTLATVMLLIAISQCFKIRVVRFGLLGTAMFLRAFRFTIDAKQKRREPQKVVFFNGEVVNESLLYRTNELVINWVFFALMLMATEVGFRLGRKVEARTPDNIKAQIFTVEAAILGILALLLGFTMSMAVSRFEIRKQLVLEEADAIGTSSLRAQLLPAPAGPRDLESSSPVCQYPGAIRDCRK